MKSRLRLAGAARGLREGVRVVILPGLPDRAQGLGGFKGNIHTYYMYIYTYVICMHTYVHTYIHTYIQTIHTYIHTYMHACIHTYIHTCIHTYMHIYNVSCSKGSATKGRVRRCCSTGSFESTLYHGPLVSYICILCIYIYIYMYT